MFTIKKLAGHSSVPVSERYVHPTGEMVELAFDRLEALNKNAAQKVMKKVAAKLGTESQRQQLRY